MKWMDYINSPPSMNNPASIIAACSAPSPPPAPAPAPVPPPPPPPPPEPVVQAPPGVPPAKVEVPVEQQIDEKGQTIAGKMRARGAGAGTAGSITGTSTGTYDLLAPTNSTSGRL